MLKKSVQVKFEEQDGGKIIGYASTFDRIPDSYGDIIAPGAFTETLKDWSESGLPIPFLFGHRLDDPFMNIGSVTDAKEDERGLRFEATFDPDSETAQYCRKLALEGRIHQFSFAFDVLEDGMVTLDDGTKAHELRKLKIYEISLVPIPANAFATVEDVKAADDGTDKPDIDELEDNLQHLREQLQELRDQMNDLAAELEQITQGDIEDEGDPEASASGKGARLLEQIQAYL